MTKNEIIGFFRKPLTKIITRAVVYGLTAWMGLTAAEAEGAGVQLAAGLGALACLGIAAIVDRFHHKKDTAGE